LGLPEAAFNHPDARLLEVKVTRITIEVEFAAFEHDSVSTEPASRLYEQSCIFKLSFEGLLDLLRD